MLGPSSISIASTAHLDGFLLLVTSQHRVHDSASSAGVDDSTSEPWLSSAIVLLVSVLPDQTQSGTVNEIEDEVETVEQCCDFLWSVCMVLVCVKDGLLCLLHQQFLEDHPLPLPSHNGQKGSRMGARRSFLEPFPSISASVAFSS